jgi:L-fuconolactonase
MRRESHVRFSEGGGVRFPSATRLIDCFGPDRLMWGSDWPVVNLAGGYARWREATVTLLASLSTRECAAILGGTALEFYGLTRH